MELGHECFLFGLWQKDADVPEMRGGAIIAASDLYQNVKPHTSPQRMVQRLPGTAEDKYSYVKPSYIHVFEISRKRRKRIPKDQDQKDLENGILYSPIQGCLKACAWHGVLHSFFNATTLLPPPSKSDRCKDSNL